MKVSSLICSFILWYLLLTTFIIVINVITIINIVTIIIILTIVYINIATAIYCCLIQDKSITTDTKSQAIKEIHDNQIYSLFMRPPKVLEETLTLDMALANFGVSSTLRSNVTTMTTSLGLKTSLKLAQAVGFNKYHREDGSSINTSTVLTVPIIPLDKEQLNIQDRMLCTGIYPSINGDLLLPMILKVNRDKDSKEWKRNIEFVCELNRNEKEHVSFFMFDLLNIK